MPAPPSGSLHRDSLKTHNHQKVGKMLPFPLDNPDDPETFYLDPDRWERVHLKDAPAPERPPAGRVESFQPVFLGYGERQAVVEATRCIHCPAT